MDFFDSKYMKSLMFGNDYRPEGCCQDFDYMKIVAWRVAILLKYRSVIFMPETNLY